MSFLDALPDHYRLILCDVWGVVHDGAHLYPGAAERLQAWRGEGRKVVLITNAPRTADVIEAQLHRLGLPQTAWDAIATSGEAGIAALRELGKPVGFIGTEEDRRIVERAGLTVANGGDFTDLAAAGVTPERPSLADYEPELRAAAERGVTLHVLNPDRVVLHRGERMVCAGAFGDFYEAIGGRVCWYGKPGAAIYRHALKLAGDPPPDAVLAIGDSLETDMAGAARMGFGGLFVHGGIHADEPLPEDIGAHVGVPGWRPVAVVQSLA